MQRLHLLTSQQNDHQILLERDKVTKIINQTFRRKNLFLGQNKNVWKVTSIRFGIFFCFGLCKSRTKTTKYYYNLQDRYWIDTQRPRPIHVLYTSMPVATFSIKKKKILLNRKNILLVLPINPDMSNVVLKCNISAPLLGQQLTS